MAAVEAAGLPKASLMDDAGLTFEKVRAPASARNGGRPGEARRSHGSMKRSTATLPPRVCSPRLQGMRLLLTTDA